MMYMNVYWCMYIYIYYICMYIYWMCIYIYNTYRSVSRWSSSICLFLGHLWHTSPDGSSERPAYFWEDVLSHTSFLSSQPLGKLFGSMLSIDLCGSVPSVQCFTNTFLCFLLNSLPIAFDSLALKHRWKSFFHWSLVALVLFLVSFLFSVFALMFEVASDVAKETSGAHFIFHSEVFPSAF